MHKIYCVLTSQCISTCSRWEYPRLSDHPFLFVKIPVSSGYVRFLLRLRSKITPSRYFKGITNKHRYILFLCNMFLSLLYCLYIFISFFYTKLYIENFFTFFLSLSTTFQCLATVHKITSRAKLFDHRFKFRVRKCIYFRRMRVTLYIRTRQP